MGYKILVVDDSMFMRNHLVNTLRNIPDVEDIIQAQNGEEAIDMYKKQKPDLVTMDIDMPKMNGIDAAQKICLFDFKAKIVMVTSSDQQSIIDITKKIGASGFITKPFNRDDILKVIQNI